MKKVLVTGASGFIGSYIVSEGLEKGYEMWAGMRGTSSKGYLTDERIKFAQLNLGNKEELKSQLSAYREQMGLRCYSGMPLRLPRLSLTVPSR